MATRTWLGVNGDWNNTANWTGGAVPVDNDDVVIASSSVNIDTNLNQSGVNLNSLNITRGYTGNIGNSGASLQISVDGATPTAFRVAMGGNYIYWSGTTGAIPLRIDSTGPGGFYITGGTLAHSTSLVCGLTGLVDIASGVTVNGDTITCGAAITSAAALSGGVAYLLGGSHTVTANLGTVLLGSNAALTTRGTNTITAITSHRGARHVHDSSGTITTYTLYPGAYYANGGKADHTITTLNLYAGSTAVLNVTGAVTTVTTTNQFGQK